jgi:hypothetical protein
MTETDNGVAPAQRIAIPSYFYPGAPWDRLIADAAAVGLAIVNPNSGPGAGRDEAYLSQIARARAAGIRVIGYVHTRYGARPWREVVAEVDAYYDWYEIDGIFLDEVSSAPEQLPYYRLLHTQITVREGGALVVLNPGTATDERYLEVADIIVTFEGSAGDYLALGEAPRWVGRYEPRRFWHLVHGVSSRRAMRRAIALSKERGAGWVYVTPDTMPNPWDILPPEPYWQMEIAAVQGRRHRLFWLPG